MLKGRHVRQFCTLLLCLPTFATSTTAVAEKARCPAVKEGAKLSGVSVFDGPPEEQADLVPDISRGRNVVAYAVWEVGHIFDEGRHIFLMCRYRDIDDTITVELASKVERCFYRSVSRGEGAVNCR